MKTGEANGSFNQGGVGGRISLFGWNGGYNWTYEYLSEDYHQHHDVEPLPNGNILVIAWERKTNAEAILAGRDSSLSSGDVWSEKVVELKPIGGNEAEVVWEWHFWDHLVQDFDSTKMNYGIVADHPELLNINFGAEDQDWIHFNGIDYNEELDQILLTSRNMSELYIIDHSTTTNEAAVHSGGNSEKGGDILYRWGNPQVYHRGTDFDKKLYGPHNASWIPKDSPDENKIMIFNNGYNKPGLDYSSVDVIIPALDNDNNYPIFTTEPFKPLDFFWTYEADPVESLSSPTRSGAQRLPNGNTLIAESKGGNIYEVTYEGDLVWHYRIPVGAFGVVSQGDPLVKPDLFRATRYGKDYAAFDGKDLTPSEPIEIYPYPSDCEIFGTTVSTRKIQKIKGIEIFEVSSREYIVIKNKTTEEIDIEVVDLMGRCIEKKVFSSEGEFQISSSNWENGFYFIRVYIEDTNEFLVKKIVKSSF
ncbi:MAG: aryl-sulfate sulfotransferase [Saprospiraceae bacterium]